LDAHGLSVFAADEGKAMAQGNERTLNDIRRDAERTRAGLTDTVDQLRSKVSETANDLRETVGDIRDRMSPESIKAEVSDYFQTRGERLLDYARQNPLPAAAIGVGIAYPLLGIVRSIPISVLMVGAGLFLMGTRTGQAASRKMAAMASDLADEVGDRTDAVRKNLHDAQDYASDQLNAAGATISSSADNLRQKAAAAGGTISGGVDDLKERATALAASLSTGMDSLKQKAAATADAAAGAARDTRATAGFGVQNAIGAATEFGSDAVAAVRDRASEAADRAATIVSDTMQQNPLLIGGIGLAIGALIASALPRSDFEIGLMGEASDDVQIRAKNVASQGLEAAKNMAAAVYTDVADRAEAEGISADGLKEAAHGLGQRVRKVAEVAATAAFEPSAQKAY
jgi:hypothetical protein